MYSGEGAEWGLLKVQSGIGIINTSISQIIKGSVVALKKERLWERYTQKNPHWLTEGVQLTPAGLKKLFEQTFDKGHELGLANGKVLGAKQTESGRDTSDFMKKVLGESFFSAR